MSRAVNVQVFLKDGESVEKMVRRFFKKCKKMEIVKEHLEKVSHARTTSQKKRDKVRKNKYLRKMEERKEQKKNNFRSNF